MAERSGGKRYCGEIMIILRGTEHVSFPWLEAVGCDCKFSLEDLSGLMYRFLLVDMEENGG